MAVWDIKERYDIVRSQFKKDRGIFGGGGGGDSNVIDYIKMASTGNASDFGDMTIAKGVRNAGASSTRGVFGGKHPSTAIDSIEIDSLGNAVDFGDLTSSK